MRSLFSRLHWRLGALLLLGAVGCGLLSSDITKVTFDLPAKMYSFDTAQWGIPAGNTVAVPCGGANPIQDCCNPPAPLPKPNCTANPVVCEASLCTLEQPVTVSQTMNLKAEVPELSSVNSQSLVDISLSNLHYDAKSTLNVDVPPLELFLAPDMVTDPKDAQAMKFGTVPAIAKGTSPSGDVVLEPGADALFAGYGHAFSTPFNFIASTTVSVPSGSPTPTGTITVTVTGKVAAKL
ncbi:MAG TPA: hypothetical protein VMT47_14140 [Polyangia bacterium]|nr:hypothetical protein [Polyangia bacterium]